MICDAIFTIFYNVFMFFMGGFQPLHFDFDINLTQTVKDFLAFIFFILPIDGMIDVLPLIIAVVLFRIIISFIKTIWDLLPLL